MSSSRWPRSPSPGKCSKRFCGSSRSYGRSHHQRQRETFDVMHSRATDRRSASKCQGKMARSDPRPSVRVTRDASSGQHLASVLQEGRENANIDAGLGFIWRISVYRVGVVGSPTPKKRKTLDTTQSLGEAGSGSMLSHAASSPASGNWLDWPVFSQRMIRHLPLLLLVAAFFVLEFTYPRFPDMDHETYFKAAG